jgi:type IV secretion system protein VirB6
VGLTIVLIWYGFQLISGSAESAVGIFLKVLRPALVVSLALAGSAYSENVVGLIKDFRTSLTQIYSTNPNSYALLDTISLKSIESANKAISAGFDAINILTRDFSGVLTVGAAIMCLGATLIYCLVAGGMFIIVDACLAVIFALGPIFVAAAAFRATASWFDRWLGAAFKYVITAVVVSILVTVAGGIMQKIAGMAEVAANPAQALNVMVSAVGIGGLLTILTYYAATLAAEVTGGVALNFAAAREVARSIAAPNGNQRPSQVAASKAASQNSLGMRTLAGVSALQSRAPKFNAKVGGGTITGSTGPFQFRKRTP